MKEKLLGVLASRCLGVSRRLESPWPHRTHSPTHAPLARTRSSARRDSERAAQDTRMTRCRHAPLRTLQVAASLDAASPLRASTEPRLRGSVAHGCLLVAHGCLCTTGWEPGPDANCRGAARLACGDDDALGDEVDEGEGGAVAADAEHGGVGALGRELHAQHPLVLVRHPQRHQRDAPPRVHPARRTRSHKLACFKASKATADLRASSDSESTPSGMHVICPQHGLSPFFGSSMHGMLSPAAPARETT